MKVKYKDTALKMTYECYLSGLRHLGLNISVSKFGPNFSFGKQINN